MGHFQVSGQSCSSCSTSTGIMLSLSSAFSRLRVGAPSRSSLCPQPSPILTFARHRSQLAPRKVKWLKRQKGTIPIPIGGSTKGTTLAFGEWGIRIKGNGARITGKQLETVQELIKRKLKPVKGAKVYLRVFPDVPVCIKVRAANNSWRHLGSDTYSTLCLRRVTKRVWERERERSSFGQPGMYILPLLKIDGLIIIYRVPTGRVLFEIGGVPIREELARESTFELVCY